MRRSKFVASMGLICPHIEQWTRVTSSGIFVFTSELDFLILLFVKELSTIVWE